MNKSWIVGIYNNFDNELKLCKVYASSLEEAFYHAILDMCRDEETKADQQLWINSMKSRNLDSEGIKTELFNCDLCIEGIEI